MEFNLGDTAIMKKPHPCGSDKWQIIRMGADIKLKCLGCERIIMLDRKDFAKRIRKIIPKEEE